MIPIKISFSLYSRWQRFQAMATAALYKLPRIRFGIKSIIVRAADKPSLLELMSRLHPTSPVRGLVRLGPDGDGGYLVPNDLDGIKALFSPGVSSISGFERDCADRGIQVFLADRTVNGPAESHPLFHAKKLHIGAFADDGFTTLEQWVNEMAPRPDGDLMLQMDIEGFEYEVLLSAPEELLRRFRIITIEFHGLHNLFTKAFFALGSRVFYKLLKSHNCVHIHPNNSARPVWFRGICIPPTMEFTFYRKDGDDNLGEASTYPHSLDRDNSPAPPVPLPKCWQHPVQSNVGKGRP
ncbi:MAG TPA: hypothetical protein DDZ51_09200 [Planctomycetaceae bacterium]|nr:hypothetical protein [Planctomycetaceae bacterium]